MPVDIKIVRKEEFVPYYMMAIPGLGQGTKILLATLKGELITNVKLEVSEIIDPKKADGVRKKFEAKSMSLLKQHFPSSSEETRQVLSSYLIQNTLGLGDLEPPMYDEALEEIAINGSREPAWVYHKRHGWCKTNILLPDDESVYEFASVIGRKVGRQINSLDPLMDAHLPSGDRVNATLFPISSCGNTLTIRKFSKNPWTIPNLIRGKSLTSETAALIWLCIQNELSFLVAGGTGSGKTSFLNAISCMFPPTERIISIEDTRELTLPSFLQWVPMSTREQNAEGKGEVAMLDLMVNALRMRPDRIVVGEIRRQKEAEVLFEAMHTGHSVYATLHADNAQEAISRLTNPPLNVPINMLGSLAAIVVQYRHRRLGIRRTLEFAEVQRNGEVNVLQQWDQKTDRLREINPMSSLSNTLSLYGGLSPKEIKKDIAEKASIFDWAAKHGLDDVNTIGMITGLYYEDPEYVLDLVRRDVPLKT
ncbi:MAG: type II/IV secretion system ATPase subunit [Candidatus Micrarchaeota archaeon]